MKIAAKVFAIVTVAFGIGELSKDVKVDNHGYEDLCEHVEHTLDSARIELEYIHKVNDTLIDKYFPYAEE